MDAIRRHLFESPLYVYITLSVAEAALAAMWHSRRQRKWAWALLPAPVLAGAVFLTAALVETDREKIAAALGAVGAAVERNDLPAAAQYIDANCRSPGPGEAFIDKAELMTIARQALDRWQVTDVRLRHIDTKVAGANATMQVDSRVAFRSGSYGDQSINIGWRLQWAKRRRSPDSDASRIGASPPGWRIVRIEITYPEFLRGLTF